MKRLFFILVVVGILLQGCGRIAYYSVPIKAEIPNQNKYFDVNFRGNHLALSTGYNSFILTIKNKTNKDIEINWNKTYFIINGQTNGKFMSEGTIYRDRNNVQPLDIVFAKSTFTKELWPNNYVHYLRGAADGQDMDHWGTGNGIQGIYLTVNIDGKEVKEKLLINIIKGKQH